jgi:phosphohistidine swiveling domain-containing protein
MITHISTPSVVGLDQIAPHDRTCAGGKAYNCARLKQAGFPVPDGVIVLATATDADVAAVPDHPWFDTQPRSASYAVRSSGIDEDGEGESFAGIHESFLDVPREQLADAVRRCRASALAAQALEYRRAKNISTDDIKIGVLIQLMVHPIAAGVAFTVNPVTGAHDELVINSSWGLGEALVSGQVDPDEFVVAKQDRSVRWSRIGGKGEDGDSAAASLGPDQIRELGDISIAIENEYGAAQDIEWCWDGARFWIVQSRPVTTMAAPADEPEWTRANLAEVMPDVTSYQALVAFEELLERAERKHLGSLAAAAETLGPVVKAFHGRLYFNLTQLRRVCTLGNTPPAMMLRSMGHADAISSADEQVERAPTRETLRALPSMLSIAWRHIRVEREISRHDARTKRVLERFTSRDPKQLSDVEICSNLVEWLAETPEYVQPVLLLGGVLFHETPVSKACAKVGFSFEQLVYPQLAIGERSVSAQQAFDLVALANVARNEPGVAEYLTTSTPSLADLRARLDGTTFLSNFERFLETYGHRGLYEYDWSLPKYAEDPTPLLLTLRAHLSAGANADAPEEIESREHRAREAWAAFEGRLSMWQRWTMLRSVRRAVGQIKKYYVWREQVRFDLVKCLAAVRAWHLVLADRFIERGWLATRSDYFQLTFAELAAAVRGELLPERLLAMAAERSRENERNRALRMPLLMRASTLPSLMRTADINGGSLNDDELTGLPVSGGCVEAEVVIVRSPDDFSRMKRGAILVAPATDPSWTPLFTLASGVIVEIGGVLSHASTIAREYGLPALANVKHATRRLRNGERVRLDAHAGRVSRMQTGG